ncbi:hypothetical protein ANANG_G00272400, partial [Anguilla anguilla]
MCTGMLLKRRCDFRTPCRLFGETVKHCTRDPPLPQRKTSELNESPAGPGGGSRGVTLLGYRGGRQRRRSRAQQQIFRSRRQIKARHHQHATTPGARYATTPGPRYVMTSGPRYVM